MTGAPLLAANRSSGLLVDTIDATLELGAYETLWCEHNASFRTIAEKFAERIALALVEQKNSIGPPRHPMGLARMPNHRLQGRAFFGAQKSTMYHGHAKNRFAAGLPQLFSGPRRVGV